MAKRPETMQAAFLAGTEDVRLGVLPFPEPKPDEALLKIRGIGICGSDLHYYQEGGIGGVLVDELFVPGHEIAAEVTEEGAERLGLPAGTLVAVEPGKHCGHCEWCHAGHVNLCPNIVFSGAPPHPGGLSEYFAAPIQSILPVPAGFDTEATVMLEPLGVAVHAMNLAKAREGETVAVLGCGPIGLLMVRLARLAGAAEVFAIDPVAYRAEGARALGADRHGDRVAAIRDWTRGRGADLVLEATDSAAGLQHAAEACRIGGRVVIAGIPEGDSYRLEAALARRKGLAIKMVRRMGDVWAQAIELVESGQVDVRAIVTHRYDLTQAPEAFAFTARRAEGVLKTIVCPGEGR